MLINRNFQNLNLAQRVSTVRALTGSIRSRFRVADGSTCMNECGLVRRLALFVLLPSSDDAFVYDGDVYDDGDAFAVRRSVVGPSLWMLVATIGILLHDEMRL